MIYDPSDPETLSNPYPYFSYLRRTDPVHWNNSLKSWVITKYDDVRKILSEDFITVDRLNRFYSKLPGKEAKLLEDSGSTSKKITNPTEDGVSRVDIKKMSKSNFLD